MSNAVYVSQGFIIHPHLQSIERDGKVIPVRPKTFALLLFLLNHPREVVSKQALLDSVWDDVTVEEQVLVQSIRELRKLFGSSEVIQTYPRKGYAWSADVQRQESDPLLPPAMRQPLHRSVFVLFFIALIAIVLITVAARYTSTTTPQPEIVIVLPVKNKVPGNELHWINIGAMDQLIQSLVSTEQIQVMHTEYVLNLMRHAAVPRDYSSEHIARVFDVSGATLVVDSEVSGSVGEYRLTYKLHAAGQVRRGVLFAETPAALLQQFATTIADSLSPTIQRNALHSHQQFGNELMARAQESLAANELEAARTLLESLNQLDPDYPGALQSLVNVLIEQEEYGLATSKIEQALGRPDVIESKEAGHFYYSLAVTHSRRGKLIQALAALDQADEFSQRDSDLLYQAFSAQLRGSILQQQQQFASAGEALTQALATHRMLRCSVGMVLTQLQLVSLFAAQNNTRVATQHYAEAKRLVEERELGNLQEDLARAQNLLN